MTPLSRTQSAGNPTVDGLPRTQIVAGHLPLTQSAVGAVGGLPAVAFSRGSGAIFAVSFL